MMDLIGARYMLEKCWDMDTSYDPDKYYGEDPAYGQCAVTALVLQDLFGGDIMSGEFMMKKKKGRHFWNRINGLDVDLTWRQFPAGTVIVTKGKVPRYKLTGQKTLKKRYLTLLKRVHDGCRQLERV